MNRNRFFKKTFDPKHCSPHDRFFVNQLAQNPFSSYSYSHAYQSYSEGGVVEGVRLEKLMLDWSFGEVGKLRAKGVVVSRLLLFCSCLLHLS